MPFTISLDKSFLSRLNVFYGGRISGISTDIIFGIHTGYEVMRFNKATYRHGDEFQDIRPWMQKDEYRKYLSSEREREEQLEQSYYSEVASRYNNTPIAFVRAKEYMQVAKTRRKLLLPEGAIQAFPIRRGAIGLLNDSHDVEFKEIVIPKGIKIFSLSWEEADRYVTATEGCQGSHPEWVPFEDSHAAEAEYSECGIGRYGLRVRVTHQVFLCK